MINHQEILNKIEIVRLSKLMKVRPIILFEGNTTLDVAKMALLGQVRGSDQLTVNSLKNLAFPNWIPINNENPQIATGLNSDPTLITAAFSSARQRDFESLRQKIDDLKASGLFSINDPKSQQKLFGELDNHFAFLPNIFVPQKDIDQSGKISSIELLMLSNLSDTPSKGGKNSVWTIQQALQ